MSDRRSFFKQGAAMLTAVAMAKLPSVAEPEPAPIAVDVSEWGTTVKVRELSSHEVVGFNVFGRMQYYSKPGWR